MADSLTFNHGDQFEDDYGDIPEIDLSINVQPYMYEPTENGDGENGLDSSDESSGNESDDSVQAVDEWCTCNNCIAMPSARECRCCCSMSEVQKEMEDLNVSCITLHEGFVANCLNRHVLKASYYEFIENNGVPDEPVHEVYRYIAYRRFARWIWGILGRRNRKVLPSCAVMAIRNQFPSQRYCGFKYPQ